MKKHLFFFAFFVAAHGLLAQQEIFDAIRNNDMGTFMQHLDKANKKASIREGDLLYEGYTPLMCAALYQREDMVLELLKRKVNVNATCKITEGYEIDGCYARVSGLTALLIAAAKGNENIVKLLMRAKASTQKYMKLKFLDQKCYKVGAGWFATDINIGPQKYAEMFKHENIAKLIRSAKGSKWIKEPIK